MKRLLRRVGYWVRRIASLGADRNLAEGNLVGNKAVPVVVDTLVEEGSRVQIERKHFVGEGGIPAAVEAGRVAEENPVVGDTATPVVVKMDHLAVGSNPGVVGAKANLVVEGRVNPVAEDKAIPAVVGTVVY